MNAPKVEVSYNRRWVNDREVTPTDLRLTIDGRPLIVIDPEGRDLCWLPNRLRLDAARIGGTTATIMCSLADQIDKQVAQPKPDEPKGWLAAVEDVNGDRWCLHGGPVEPGLEWYSPDLNIRRPYADIAAVRVLSEGVQA